VQRALNDARMRLQAALKEKERADSVAARWASEVADRQNEIAEYVAALRELNLKWSAEGGLVERPTPPRGEWGG
jgi:anti-sigma factor RsiW